ncbi:hypothetical protein [Pseudomonas sp. FP215]
MLINRVSPELLAPFGGVKQSGGGRRGWSRNPGRRNKS